MPGIDCLKNLVGIKRGCGTTAPTSGLYINDPKLGITVNITNDLANEENASGYEVITEIMDQATIEFESDIRTFLGPRVRLVSLVDSERIGVLQENLKTVTALTGQFAGIFINMQEYADLSMELGSVFLTASQTKDTDIHIINLMTGHTVETKTISAIAGQTVELALGNVFRVDSRQHLQLMIAVDTDDITVYETNIHASHSGCSSCGSNMYKHNRYVSSNAVRLSKTASKVRNNTASINHTYGLSVSYSVKCSIDRFVCSIKDTLAVPFKYKVAGDIMQAMVNNHELGSYVMIYREENEENQKDFHEIYEENMKNILQNMRLPDGYCWGCQPGAAYKSAFP